MSNEQGDLSPESGFEISSSEGITPAVRISSRTWVIKKNTDYNAQKMKKHIKIFDRILPT